MLRELIIKGKEKVFALSRVWIFLGGFPHENRGTGKPVPYILHFILSEFVLTAINSLGQKRLSKFRGIPIKNKKMGNSWCFRLLTIDSRLTIIGGYAAKAQEQ